MNTMEDFSILLCEGIPRQNWIGKCLVLQNASSVTVASGICRNVSSDVVIGSLRPLEDTHVVVQISTSLCKDDVPNEWRYYV